MSRHRSAPRTFAGTPFSAAHTLAASFFPAAHTFAGTPFFATERVARERDAGAHLSAAAQCGAGVVSLAAGQEVAR
ncbi:hypothetical protein [Actinoplanes sp. RD1]|uniref:hypothetical protein n=1 Tax=Actinoplanes sp. RD1 TaxID=3064538 RepID=UPI002741021F|nr:hypothetical protein [Actinoplanes sp. RD1]